MRFILRLVLMLLALATALIALSAGIARSGEDAASGWVAYADRGPGGTTGIFRAHPDGLRRRFLTPGFVTASQPAFSPDGLWIAFWGARDSRYGLYLMRADGREPRVVAAFDFVPAVGGMTWSADGQRALFSSSFSGVEYDGRVYTTQFRRIWLDDGAVDIWRSAGGGFDGEWRAADGAVRADGGDFARLVRASGLSGARPWLTTQDSGSALSIVAQMRPVFVARDWAILTSADLDPGAANTAIFRAAFGADGQPQLDAPERLIDLPEPITNVSLSPDGRAVAVATTSAGGINIYRLDVESRALAQLVADNGGGEARVGWSPDGRWIALHANQPGSDHIYTLPSAPARGGTLADALRLTQASMRHDVAAWSPPIAKPAAWGALAGIAGAALAIMGMMGKTGHNSAT